MCKDHVYICYHEFGSFKIMTASSKNDRIFSGKRMNPRFVLCRDWLAGPREYLSGILSRGKD